MTFKANYFNGISSKTIDVKIHTNPSSWVLFFLDENDSEKEVVWKIDQIKKSEVYTKGLVAFSYGDEFPFQKIESKDPNFIAYVSNSDHKNINNKVDAWLHKSVAKSIVFLFFAILGITLSMYFYVIPNVAVGFAGKLPKAQVVSFGDQVFKTMSADLMIHADTSRKLQEFVDELSIDCEFPIEAFVAESEELNAFAISGGKIVVFSGLLEKIENEHQLTALIGHEVSHVRERHMLKNVSRNLSGSLFLSIILNDINAVYGVVMENAHMFSQLSFTRELEKEADVFGMELMKKNNVSLQGMPELFEILKENTKDNTPSFLSSHPILEDRIVYTKQLADQQSSFIKNVTLEAKWFQLIKNDTYLDFEKRAENNE